MASDDAPAHFSWEEIYSLYSIPVVEIPILSNVGTVRDFIVDEPPSTGDEDIAPIPRTTPIEAYSN